MNWRLPGRYRDYLPDRNTIDTDRLARYLPSRSSLPSLGLFDRRRKNTGTTVAIGVAAAALVGLGVGAWLVSRDRALAEAERNSVPRGRSNFGHKTKV